MLTRFLLKGILSFLFGAVIATGISFLFKTYNSTIQDNVKLRAIIEEKDKEIQALKKKVEELKNRKNRVIVKYKTRVLKEREKCERIVKIIKREKPRKPVPPSDDPVLRDLNSLWGENESNN